MHRKLPFFLSALFAGAICCGILAGLSAGTKSKDEGEHRLNPGVVMGGILGGLAGSGFFTRRRAQVNLRDRQPKK